jgi:hypothetical protein
MNNLENIVEIINGQALVRPPNNQEIVEKINEIVQFINKQIYDRGNSR